MKTLLQVQNLTKFYKDSRAVNNISFEIKQGEIIGLLGPNGAGKSTTIQMLLGLLSPTKGTIEIFGKDLKKHREEILTKMNFAAPYTPLPYNLTPYENLMVFALLYGVKDSKKKVEKLLNEFKLAEFRNEKSGGLSSGEQTRLGLAKAFLNEPQLLLLDEPTASLDPVIARDLRNEIYSRTKGQNKAVLWTSHNMNEMDSMCDRIIFLRNGKIVANDTPQKLKEQFSKTDLEEVFVSLANEISL